PGQINAQVPLECPGAGVMTATVNVGGQVSTQTFVMAPAAPGIFTVNASGTGDGGILHANNTLVNTQNPARAGETVVIYATGLGASTPAFATGAVANQSNTSAMAIAVTIGGRDAAVVFHGRTQGFVGLDQINVTVPSGVSGNVQVL